MSSDTNQAGSRFDVVVVGGGGSGLAAAVQAAQLGSSVVVLEKNARLGGTTALSIGSMSASLTTMQYQTGIYDSHDSHYTDMAHFAGDLLDRDNLTLRRVFVENSGPTLEWLRSLGIAFFGPMPEPPHENPRMHNVLPNSRAYIHYLHRAAQRLGVTIRLNSRVTGLAVEDGRVVGVECDGPSGAFTTFGAGGVILAAGDFSSSQELKHAYMDDVASTVPGINPTSTGDGIRLGITAGGHVVNSDLALGPELRFAVPEKKLLVQRIPPSRLVTRTMQLAVDYLPDRVIRPVIMRFATSYLAPTPRLFHDGAILVNKAGERFTDECRTPWLDLPGQEAGAGYILIDKNLADRLTEWPNYISTAPGVAYAFLRDYERNRRDVFHRARSAPELARKIGVPETALRRSIDSAKETGNSDWTPPYVALGPVYSWIVLTEGGLAVDASLRVLTPAGDPIPGLYAVGSNGQGGLILEGHGNHIGWAFVSGRLAGMATRARSTT